MIQVTEKAIAEIKKILHKEKEEKKSATLEQKEAASQSYLRVKVIGKGCSGMSYKLGFDHDPTTDQDKTYEKDGLKIVIDSKSMLYLKGTELDFTDGLQGTGFVFNNPNAKRTCGCGSSFSV